MFDLRWFFIHNIEDVDNTLNEGEKCEFLDKLYGVLKYIDDEIILAQKSVINYDMKLFLLAKKHDAHIVLSKDAGGEWFFCLKNTDLNVDSWYQRELIPLSKCQLRLDFLSLDDFGITIEGKFTYLGYEEDISFDQYISVNETYIKCERVCVPTEYLTCLDEVASFKTAFKAIIPMNLLRSFGDSKIEIRLCNKIGDDYVERKSIIVGKFFPIVNNLRGIYAKIGSWLVYFQGSLLIFEKASLYRHIKKKYGFYKVLWWYYRNKKDKAALKAMFARTIVHLVKPFIHREIWLFSDRINKADDNAEALFKFVNEQQKPVNAYYVIREDSPDYPEVLKLGKVLKYRSWKHKILHLMADKTVSSAGDEFVYNPFDGISKYYRDFMYRTKHVFLQHGIIENDLSLWLNRYNHNLSMFVTSVSPEYESIINGNYFYDEKVVKLTGLPRHDRLIDKKEKIITIMPSWRQYLVDWSTTKYSVDGVDKYNNDVLINSEFFKFYNSLLNDERLLQCAREYGYKIRFMPHVNWMGIIDLFDKNDYVEFCSISTHYRDIFSTSAMIVTDYSSVAFDFAYMRKPLIYAQFDKEEFFTDQWQHGYFDYERDGFGEVEYTLDAVVDRLMEYIRSDCPLKDVYRERIEKFFKFHDTNNCQRVYDEITKI